MKIKLKLQNGWNNELEVLGAYCSIPYIYDDKRLLMFNGKNIGIEINKNIWIQLPESLKKEIYKTSFEYLVAKNFLYLKNALVKINGITAYQLISSDIQMEKIFEDFNRNETMMMFETHGIFPNEVFSLYVQTKEDIYIEFDIDDIIKENFFQRKEKIEKELNESYKIGRLKDIYNQIENDEIKLINTNITENNISREEWKERILKILSYQPSEIDNFFEALTELWNLICIDKYLSCNVENLKEKLGYWILNISYYLNTEKEKSIILNIKKRLNIKSLDYISV
ncbi:hypothetical protein [Leptotrichia hongkongensis]|jgi:hypothetical protein|uniref:hypothetical protein n=1 Tax=Leptotrichia hongkongensis TaxID=554406 RepID=UPI0035A8CA65